MKDIAYENLPTETIRSLCDMAISSGHATLMRPENKEILKDVSALDLRILARLRLSGGYSARELWRSMKSNKDAALILVNTYLEMSKTNSYLSPEFRDDIDWDILTDPQMWDLMWNNAPTRRFMPSTYSMPVTGNTSSVPSYMKWFENDPVRSAKTFASTDSYFSALFPREYSSEDSRDKRIDIICKSIGFMHLWDRDRPHYMRGLHDAATSYRSRTDYLPMLDQLMYTLCCVARKSEDNMNMMKSDMESKDFARKTRNETPWFCNYMAGLCVRNEELAMKMVKEIPYLFKALPADLKKHREVRSLRRLLQVGGYI